MLSTTIWCPLRLTLYLTTLRIPATRIYWFCDLDWHLCVDFSGRPDLKLHEGLWAGVCKWISVYLHPLTSESIQVQKKMKKDCIIFHFSRSSNRSEETWCKQTQVYMQQPIDPTPVYKLLLTKFWTTWMSQKCYFSHSAPIQQGVCLRTPMWTVQRCAMWKDHLCATVAHHRCVRGTLTLKVGGAHCTQTHTIHMKVQLRLSLPGSWDSLTPSQNREHIWHRLASGHSDPASPVLMTNWSVCSIAGQ